MDAARKLVLLAADIEPEADPVLWDVLREGTERRWGVTRDVGKTLSEALLEIAVEMDYESRQHVSLMRILEVVTKMERHCLGHEGMEDSPVARWARELRKALGGDAETDEDCEAAAWVREHGGLDYVRAEWRSRVPYDRYEARRQRLLGHIAECETALGRRRRRIEELGRTVEFFQLNNSNFRHLLADVAERLGFTRYGDDYEPEDLLDALDRRLMPDGMEWPRYDDGEPVRFEDELPDFAGTIYKTVKSIRFNNYGYVVIDNAGGSANVNVILKSGQRIKRPAVLASDGEPLEVGQTVWWLNNPSCNLTVDRVDSPECVSVTDRSGDETQGLSGIPARELTHQRPVLDADGVPIKVGDTVWHKATGTKYRVFRFSAEENRVWGENDIGSFFIDCSTLTHTKPEPPDSWERIEEDVKRDKCDYFGYAGKRCYGCPAFDVPDSCISVKTADLVRRCRALAERGEK